MVDTRTTDIIYLDLCKAFDSVLSDILASKWKDMDLMDEPLGGKELAGWLCSKSCTQWRNVQVEISYEWYSSGVSIGLALFNIFVGDLDSEIECAVSKFVENAKLYGAVSTMEGGLKTWAYVNIMKFNEAKSKVLHLGQGNPKQ